MVESTAYERNPCSDDDADGGTSERKRSASRHWLLAPCILAAWGVLAGCHGAMKAGKRGTGGNTGSGSGGQYKEVLSTGGAAGSDKIPDSSVGGEAAGSVSFGGSPGGIAAGGLGGVTSVRRVPVNTGGWAGADAGTATTGGIPGLGDGTAVGSGGMAPISEPVDDRPPRPAWQQPFTTPLGTPGWQQSTQPICDANQGVFSHGVFNVWADHRGVFALIGDGCEPSMGVLCGRKEGASIKFNSGSGWQLLHQFPPGVNQSPMLWPSVTNGPLLVTGTLAPDKDGAAFIDNGIFAFHGLANGSWGGFAVGPDLAYVLDGANLLRYSGGAWSTVGTAALSLQAIWAGPEGVIVAGPNQTIATQAGTGPLTPLPGVPVGSYQAVWSFAANDIWFGNSANQLLHYDGDKWQVHATGSKSTGGILNLWGTSGTVYFTTGMEFGRWNGSQVEILLRASSSANTFGTIWGRSQSEVFIAIRDPRYQNNACGSVFILWFDGTQFHQF